MGKSAVFKYSIFIFHKLLVFRGNLVNAPPGGLPDKDETAEENGPGEEKEKKKIPLKPPFMRATDAKYF